MKMYLITVPWRCRVQEVKNYFFCQKFSFLSLCTMVPTKLYSFSLLYSTLFYGCFHTSKITLLLKKSSGNIGQLKRKCSIPLAVSKLLTNKNEWRATSSSVYGNNLSKRGPSFAIDGSISASTEHMFVRYACIFFHQFCY